VEQDSIICKYNYPDFNENDHNKSRRYNPIKPEYKNQLLHYKIYGEIYDDISENNINKMIANDPGNPSSPNFNNANTLVNVAQAAITQMNVAEKAAAQAENAALQAELDANNNPGNVTKATIATNARTAATNAKLAANRAKNAANVAITNALPLDATIKNVVVDIDYKELIKENQKNIFNPDEYDNEHAFKIYGGIPPPPEVRKLVEMIYTNLGTKSLKEILIDLLVYPNSVFAKYIHNRVGTIVNEEEKNMINPHKKDFIKGELIAREINANSFVWSLYLDKNSINTHNILTVRIETGNTTFEVIQVTLDEIYRVFGTVKQSFSPNHKLSEEDLLDTYIINSQA
jgi:hypothetical protein